MPIDKNINLKELRVGNLVYDEYCLFQEIDIESFINYKQGSLKPIPLTDDTLLKFGFEKEEFWEDYILEKEVFLQNENDGYGLIKCLDGFKFCVDSETGFNTINEKLYNYLHEIQNLYFALTNTELVCQ